MESGGRPKEEPEEKLGIKNRVRQIKDALDPLIIIRTQLRIEPYQTPQIQEDQRTVISRMKNKYLS